MKNMKKFVAIATAATLALVPMTAFASQANLNPGEDQTIGGDVNYVNTTVYQVTLPTTDAMEFALDPQGLTSLDGGSYSDAGAGAIVSDTLMTAVNESSVALKLEASFYVVDSTDSLVLVDSESDIDDDAHEMKLTIQHDTDGNDSSYTDLVTVTSQDSAAPSIGEFEMAAADYEFNGSSNAGFTYDFVASSGKELNMKITGTVAKNYDWSAYTGDDAATIELHAIFKFVDEAATPEEPEPTEPEEAYAYFSGDSLKVWLDLSEEANGGLTEAGKLTSVTVAQNDGEAADVTFSVSQNYGLVTWADMKTAGCTWKTGDTYTFTFVYDGTTYTATVTAA